MSVRLFVAPLAEQDLADIAEFISKDNVQAAYDVLNRIEGVVDLLLQRPCIGPTVVKPKRPGLRKMTAAPYIIFYRLVGDALRFFVFFIPRVILVTKSCSHCENAKSR
jgi:plasmid stabilization system protein ParE